MQASRQGDSTSPVQPCAVSFERAALKKRRTAWAGWPAWTTVPVEMLNLEAFDDAGHETTDPLITSFERGQ